MLDFFNVFLVLAVLFGLAIFVKFVLVLFKKKVSHKARFIFKVLNQNFNEDYKSLQKIRSFVGSEQKSRERPKGIS